MSEIFYRAEAAIKKENYVNLFCSPGVIQIKGRRLPLRKITYFKDAIILLDSIDEVTCHEHRKLFINACICSGKVLLPSSFSEYSYY